MKNKIKPKTQFEKEKINEIIWWKNSNLQEVNKIEIIILKNKK